MRHKSIFVALAVTTLSTTLFAFTEKHYYSNGILREIVEYNDSNETLVNRYRQGKTTAFYEDGKTVAYTVNYDHGKEEGNKTWYDKQGHIIGIMPYKHGLRHGQHTLYYSNGNKRLEVRFVNDLEEGPYKEYYEDGTLALEVTYKKGRKEGVQKEYYPSGKLQSTVTYVNGYKEGEKKWYDENGTVIRTESYKMDRPIKVMKKLEAKKPDAAQQFLKTLNFNPNDHHMR